MSGSFAVEEEAHGPCRLAVHHLVLLEGVHPDSVLDGRSELARRENVRVGPVAVLRVVGEELEVRRLEGVAVVAPRGVARRRDCDAVPERLARIVEPARRELGKDPAVGDLVVEDDRVARRVGAVRHREIAPERARVDRSEEPVPGLVVDGEGEVHHLDVVVRPHLADRVGRVHADAEDVEVVLVAQPFEVLLRRRDRRRQQCRLQRAVARVAAVGTCPRAEVELVRRVFGIGRDPVRRENPKRRRDVVGRVPSDCGLGVCRRLCGLHGSHRALGRPCACHRRKETDEKRESAGQPEPPARVRRRSVHRRALPCNRQHDIFERPTLPLRAGSTRAAIHYRIVRLAVVGAVALAAPMLSLGGANAATTRISGLRGLVLRSTPVCQTDHCEEPAGGVLLRFTRAGRVVTTVKSTSEGRYSIRLRPGTYRVKAPARPVGTGLAPRVVRVPRGRIVHVDFHLDTGTQ